MDTDAFQMNIQGVANLIESDVNKTLVDGIPEEGVQGQPEDALKLGMDNEDLMELKEGWEVKNATYLPKIKKKQDLNKLYYLGMQRQAMGISTVPVPSNLIFEAQETFIPQALAKNPEPVVWSDNTDEGKEAADDIKTMLQYHADVLCLRKKLGVMVRHWSIYFTGILKYGWDEKTNDILVEIRDPRNFILDPDGYVNEFGDYVGAFLGERVECSARELIRLYPKHRDYIYIKCDGKLGTIVTRTEWWTNELSFTTFEDEVLDKHKNEFFNYDTDKESTDEYGLTHKETLKGQNHFATPKMPYTFLSVFSLQEHPYDDTNLIEQNIANQDRINDRDYQIDKNLRVSNNSLLISTNAGNIETAKLMAQGIEDGDPILVEGAIGDNVQRLPANALPSGLLDSQQIDKDTLRSIFGTQGSTAQAPNEDTTARGMILNSQMDSSRIGGGIGDAIEQVADNAFNWMLQLYYVFYDEPHYAAIMGSGKAVSYVVLQMSDQQRRFVVSVTPDSMKPHDEITEMNQAVQLADSGWLDPISLFKKLNFPNPQETAKMVTLFRLDPAQYYAMNFGQTNEQQPGQQQEPGGQIPPQPGGDQGTLSAPPPSSSLSQVPINSQSLPK